MVSRLHARGKVNRRKEASGGWYPWLRTDPNRADTGYGACLGKCQRYTPILQAVCNWGNCTEMWCGECKRFSGGFGPMGCPCDDGNTSGGKGHHTKAEQARPRNKGRKR